MKEGFFEVEKFKYPDELRFTLKALLSPAAVRELIAKRREYWEANYPILSPLHDQGRTIGEYSAPDEPVSTLVSASHTETPTR